MDNKALKNKKLNNILITGGEVIDVVNKKTKKADILIEGGLVKKINEKLNPDDFNRDAFKVIDANGLVVCPGFFDMHVHLREPGDEDEEDLESGIISALRGGVTSMACMPNTKPVIDTQYLVKSLKMNSHYHDFDIYPVAAMTRGLEGEIMAEMGLLKEAGAVAFSDDGRCIQDARLIYEIMKYAVQMDVPLILHEEDYSFSDGGLVHDGVYSAATGLEGISNLSEDLIIARDLMLAKKTSARIHLTHLSSGISVDLVRSAKKNNIKVTCDVTPEHFFFNDSCIETYNTNFKIKPPIRSEYDRKCIIDGIKDGTIDAIASDHAPHLGSEKETSFNDAAFGSIGLETLFKASLTKLNKEEGINLEKVMGLISNSPSKIIRNRECVIKEGHTANICIVDIGCLRKYTKDMIVSKSKNSAFLGANLYGEIIYTIANGNLRFINENEIHRKDCF
jgi:dihydroorotase